MRFSGPWWTILPLSFLMTASGLAGVSYEILYGRMLGNVLGDQFLVSASVLITFLAGIGLGSRQAFRFPLWMVEAGIGLYALLMAHSASALEWLTYHGAAWLGGGIVGSVAVGVALLFPPAFLVGCSVPLFAALRNNAGIQASRRSFSVAYGAYNLGAACTALLVEFAFLRWWGLTHTISMLGVVNLVVAGVLFLYPRAEASCETEQSFRFVWRDRRMAALILASIGSAAYQLYMVKYAELVFGPFRESFALVLSIILVGIALGSFLVRVLDVRFHVPLLMSVIGLLWLMWAAEPAIRVYAALYDLASQGYWRLVTLKWMLLAGLMLIPATAFGALIPAVIRERREVSRESGSWLFISSIANVFGFLIMTFVLHRYLDYGAQLGVIVVFCLLALLIAGKPVWRSVGVALVALPVMGWMLLHHWDENLLYLGYTRFHDLDRLERARTELIRADRYKGREDVFSINWLKGGRPFFFINGYISIPLDNPSEKIVGALGSMFSPRLDQALVLGLGSGATASTVGLFFRHTDVVEINPVVRANLWRMKRWNFDIERNPSVRIVVDDALHYVRASHDRYSLVLNTVTTPLYFSSSKLYTQDFLERVKKRLTPDGVYVTWMDARIGDTGADIILRTLRQTFRHCAVLYVKSAYFLLAASDRPLRMRQRTPVTTHPRLVERLMHQHHVVASWLPWHLMTPDVFPIVPTEGAVNTADRPVLEFEMARLRRGGLPRFKERLISMLDAERVADAAGGVSDAFPADLLLQAIDRLDNTSITRAWRNRVSKQPGFRRKMLLAELHRRHLAATVLNTPSTWHAFGYQLMRLGEYRKAAAVFRRVLRMDPDHDNAAYNLGVCLEHLGRMAQALLAFQQELANDPDDEDVEFRIGRLLVRAGHDREGAARLRSYLRTAGSKARTEARALLAIALKRMGDKHEARKVMRAALGLSESDGVLLDWP